MRSRGFVYRYYTNNVDYDCLLLFWLLPFRMLLNKNKYVCVFKQEVFLYVYRIHASWTYKKEVIKYTILHKKWET